MSPTANRYRHNRLKQLRGFCQAAKTGSISRAAEDLFLSQPSVSLQIMALEREFDATLFDRHGPKIHLTPEGELLFELAQPLVRGLEDLRDEFLSQRDSVERGRLDIAAGGSTLLYVLPPYVEAFAKAYPDVELKLHNVTGKAGLAQLRSGEADFAVGPLLETPGDLSFYPIVSYDPMLITCLDHPLAKKKRLTLRDISRYPLILPPRNLSTWRMVEFVFAERQLPYEVRLEVGGWPVIKKYVSVGLGISIVMSICLREDDKLEAQPVSKYFPQRIYGVVTRKGKRLSRQARHFIQLMAPDVDILERE